MTEGLDFIIRAVLIGIGATLVMDGFVLLRKRLFGIPSLDYALVGRWIGHLPEGRVVHDDIARAAPIRGEAMLGWLVHYAIGVLFAAALLGSWGLGWAERPTLLPALIVGLATVVAPFFILQPALGAGILASKTPKPNVARLRSIVVHGSFGVGLYLSALFWASVLPQS